MKGVNIASMLGFKLEAAKAFTDAAKLMPFVPNDLVNFGIKVGYGMSKPYDKVNEVREHLKVRHNSIRLLYPNLDFGYDYGGEDKGDWMMRHFD